MIEVTVSPAADTAKDRSVPMIRVRQLARTFILLCAGCGAIPGRELPGESTAAVDTHRFELVARFAHITDTHCIDEESPARLTALAGLKEGIWRPHEACSQTS